MLLSDVSYFLAVQCLQMATQAQARRPPGGSASCSAGVHFFTVKRGT